MRIKQLRYAGDTKLCARKKRARRSARGRDRHNPPVLCSVTHATLLHISQRHKGTWMSFKSSDELSISMLVLEKYFFHKYDGIYLQFP